MSERSNQPAPWSRRALASLIDLTISLGVSLFFYVLAITAVVTIDSGTSNLLSYGLASPSQAAQRQSIYNWILFISIVIFIVIVVISSGLMMARKGSRNGQTVGKQLLKIRAVRSDGNDWTVSTALNREAIKKPLLLYLPWFGLPLVLPVFVSVADALSPFWDKPRCRTFHDRWSRSRVWRA